MPSECMFDGCTAPVYARDMCRRHWHADCQRRRWAEMPPRKKAARLRQMRERARERRKEAKDAL